MLPLRFAPALSTRFHDTFAALHHRNYRVWFIGQLVSLVGTWMQSVAQGFLVYELTKSPAFLGYVGFAGGLPSWMFMAYAGAIADRISRRILLLITQCAMMVLAVIMAVLVFTNTVQPWQVIALAFALGIANAFDAPARQSFAAELVDREDLTNAIALNATMFNTGAVVGPAVAGVVYAAVGPAWCFLLNGVSFIAVIIALVMIKVRPVERSLVGATVLSDLKEGFDYVRKSPLTMTIIATVGMVSIFAMGPITLVPAWAVEVLKGDVTTNGLLVSARGVGGVFGALILASMGRRKVRGKLITGGVIVLPLLFILFSFIRIIPLSLLVFATVGFSFMLVVNSCNALVQSFLPDHFRGRVMGIYTLIFLGSMPLGSLISGQLAAWLGEPVTVLICASIFLLYAVILVVKRRTLLALG